MTKPKVSSLKQEHNNNNIEFYFFLTSGKERMLEACGKINGHSASRPSHCPAGYNVKIF